MHIPNIHLLYTFVGGLDLIVSKEYLRNIFGQFWKIVYVKINHNKGRVFVQFDNGQEYFTL